MNDVNNRIFREFTEFFDNVEKSASEISVTMAYEITMKSTISTAIIVLESEGRLEERYWNHLRVQNNILDFLYRWCSYRSSAYQQLLPGLSGCRNNQT